MEETTKSLLEYKEQVKTARVGYKDKKNLIMNQAAVNEYNLIEKFEKEHGMSVENLQDDSEYFEYKASEIARMQEPLVKKLGHFFKRKNL